jgi:hypothetical protein
MRYFSLYPETEEIDSSGDEVIGSRWLVTSSNIQILFDHIKVMVQKGENWIFKIVRDAEEPE